MTSYRPYIAASALNKPIPTPAPIHPDSSKMIAATVNALGGAGLIPNKRGIYYRGDLSKLPTVPVYVNYDPAKGYVCASSPKLQMPMPAWFVPILKGQDNVVVNQDRNVVLVDPATGDVWETWHLTPPGMTPKDNPSCPTNRWNAALCNHYKADLSTVGYPLSGNPSGASSTKIHYALGLVIPDDFADCFAGSDPGTAVPHAIRCSGPAGDGSGGIPHFVPPARHGDGIVPGAIPEGARWQLDPKLDVAKWPSVNALREPQRSAMKKLLRGFQIYGGFWGDRSKGGGSIESCNPLSVAQGTPYGSGYKLPWEAAGYRWGTAESGSPADLMSHCRVIDWNKWTGV